MIIKYKLFEGKKYPGVGDYCIFIPSDIDFMKNYKKYIKFFSENIGIVLSIINDDISPYKVKYFPNKNDEKDFYTFSKELDFPDEDIIHFERYEFIRFATSEEQEQLKIKILSNKYNL